MLKTMQDLTELQWAKINGHKAGLSGYGSKYNPYVDNFNDTNKQLHNIWEAARVNSKQYLGI